jgi:hypothetical protein
MGWLAENNGGPKPRQSPSSRGGLISEILGVSLEFALHFADRDNTEQKALTAEIPSEVLARHRKLMLEMAREDEAAAVAKKLTSGA